MISCKGNLKLVSLSMNKTDYNINNCRDTCIREGGAFLNQYVSLSRHSFETNMIIYKVTNLINDKIYIGQTVKILERRKSDHVNLAKRGSNLYFHKALRKYGVDNFKWEVIYICPNIDILNEQEKYYIAFYNSFGEGGYNLTEGGDGMVGFKFSEESKKKMSTTRIELGLSKGENNPIYGKRGEGTPMYDKHHSKETKKKMSERMKEYYKNNPEKKPIGEKNPMYGVRLCGEKNGMYGVHRYGKDAPSYGKHRSHTPKTKEKMRQSRLKYLEKQKGVFKL